ncbi:TrkA family potassium uptake protein [Aerococcaceae bacterium DSM 111020]|nr:TrkA family potassium uptake protein [Aerococcaceae bacterium DSM 111020]
MANTIVGVLGLGIFGQTVAVELARYGTEVIAIDTDATNVQAVADKVTNAVIGDFTDIEILYEIGLNNCDIVVIATGSNLESSVLATMHCKKMNIPQIIGKAKNQTFEDVLFEIGMHTIISPERDSGFRLASKILRNHIDEVLRLDDDTSVVEFEIPESWVNHNVIELDLRKNFDINLIGYREERGENMVSLDIQQPLPADIILVGIATSHVFERHDYLNLLDHM